LGNKIGIHYIGGGMGPTVGLDLCGDFSVTACRMPELDSLKRQAKIRLNIKVWPINKEFVEKL
jgi:hypothetical protein